VVVAVSSLLSSLRRRTAAAHARLDDGLARAGGLGAERYAAFLRASLAVLGPLEPALASWLPAVVTPSRVAALRADLAALGPDAAAAPAEVPVLASLAAAYGAAYVVEGSALGGAVLADRVEAAHGPAAPTRYLRLRGRATAAHWAAFVAELARAERGFDAGAREAACAAACAVFAAYEAALVGHEVIAP
jgi:heme oxygenase (biliverdin-IX-beta and delta-forming)